MQACTDRSQSQTFSAAHLLTCGKTGTPGCKPNNELNHECIRTLSYLLTCGKMRTCGCSHSCELVGSGSGQNTSSTADASCSGSEGAHELSRQACQECKTVQGHTECQKLSLHAQNRAPPADLHPPGARRTREFRQNPAHKQLTWPESSAANRSSSTKCPPRAAFTTLAPCGIQLNSSAFKMPLRDGIWRFFNTCSAGTAGGEANGLGWYPAGQQPAYGPSPVAAQLAENRHTMQPASPPYNSQ